MKACEILYWLEGVKIRRAGWVNPNDYIVFNTEKRNWFNGTQRIDFDDIVLDLWNENDWEIYQQPKPPTKIRLYRAVMQWGNGDIDIGRWSTRKSQTDGPNGRCILWEEREIEVPL